MAEIPLPDNDYVLSEYAAWFTFGDLSIRITGLERPTSEHSPVPALQISVYKLGEEDCTELGVLEIEQPSSETPA